MHQTAMNYPFLPEPSRLQLPGDTDGAAAAFASQCRQRGFLIASALFIGRCLVRGVLIGLAALIMSGLLILTAWVVTGLLLARR